MKCDSKIAIRPEKWNFNDLELFFVYRNVSIVGGVRTMNSNKHSANNTMEIHNDASVYLFVCDFVGQVGR